MNAHRQCACTHVCKHARRHVHIRTETPIHLYAPAHMHTLHSSILFFFHNPCTASAARSIFGSLTVLAPGRMLAWTPLWGPFTSSLNTSSDGSLPTTLTFAFTFTVVRVHLRFIFCPSIQLRFHAYSRTRQCVYGHT